MPANFAGRTLTGELFGDLALEPQRANGQHVVLRLEDERVQPAIAVDGAQRVHADLQTDVLLQSVTGQRDGLQVGAEDPLCLVVGVADIVANQKTFTREFAAACHGQSLKTCTKEGRS